MDLASFRALLPYNDWANDQLLTAGEALSDEQLDHPLPISMGTFRKLILHVHIGELVWLRRWQGETDQAWLDQSEPIRPAGLVPRFAELRTTRDAWLNGLSDAQVRAEQKYLDSKGGYYVAPLGEMFLQGFVHSTHHRAQLVNMLRQLDGAPPELDYMYHVRRPADGE